MLSFNTLSFLKQKTGYFKTNRDIFPPQPSGFYGPN